MNALEIRAAEAKNAQAAQERALTALRRSPYASVRQICDAEQEYRIASMRRTLADLAVKWTTIMSDRDNVADPRTWRGCLVMFLQAVNTSYCPGRARHLAFVERMIAEHDIRGVRRFTDGTLYAQDARTPLTGNENRFRSYRDAGCGRSARDTFPILDGMRGRTVGPRVAVAQSAREAEAIVARLEATAPLPAPGILAD